MSMPGLSLDGPVVYRRNRRLITVERKDVVSKNAGKRDGDDRRPTTSKALVLRNGKYGAYGTGEVMLASKLSGREKLDLLAGKHEIIIPHQYPNES
jgi:hypothetical protein